MSDATRIPADKVPGLLRAHGLEAAGVERIPTGKFNTSYFATLRDGRVVVIRISPPDDAGFLFYERKMMAQEPGLHRLIREKTSIPVAEILVHDDSRRLIDRDFLVMARLPGEPLSRAFLDSNAARNAMFETGRYLRELHDNCRAEQYGYLGEHHPMEPAGSWAEAFKEMWFLLIEDIRACGQYEAEEAGRIQEALLPFLPLFEREVSSCLLHMDIWAQNLLVDRKGHITGIVDWDRALWGDAEIEFAVLDYCGISTSEFWEGYGQERDQSAATKTRWVFYYLYELQKYIVIRTLRNNSPDEGATYKRQAEQILAQLPSLSV